MAHDENRLTYTVAEAGELLGISRGSAYEGAKLMCTKPCDLLALSDTHSTLIVIVRGAGPPVQPRHREERTTDLRSDPDGSVAILGRSMRL